MNSSILSNAVASNNQSVGDTGTQSLSCQNREVYKCVAQHALRLCGLWSMHLTSSVPFKHIFGISNHKTHLESGSHQTVFTVQL